VIAVEGNIVLIMVEIEGPTGAQNIPAGGENEVLLINRTFEQEEIRYFLMHRIF
jgi:hypothetical protein